MKRHIYLLGLVAAALLFLYGCGNSTNPRFDLQLTDTNVRSEGEDIEIIRLNNCSGRHNMTRVAERSGVLTVEGLNGNIGASFQAIKAAVFNKYGIATSITLTAPPGKNMEFTLNWLLGKRIGTVTGKELPMEQVIFRYFAPIDVQIQTQRDLGCAF